jgi:hypothetical protein
MEEIEQLENKRAFKRMLLVIGIVVVLAGAITAFVLLKKDSKETFNASEYNTEQTGNAKDSKLYSSDTSTWKNYSWSGKVNMHYPDNWTLKEKLGNSGAIDSLEIIPPTDQASDVIFVGGTCSGLDKYAKNKCMKNTIQVPFYTDSTNPEVQEAFDLILSNTILIDIEK